MGRRRKILFITSILAGLWFLNTFALRYLTDDIGVLGIYWPRRTLLQAHIVAAALPLLAGPFLLWFGLDRLSKVVHHIVLSVYMIGAVATAVTALSLASHTGFGLVLALSFIAMAMASLIAVFFCIVAALRKMTDQYWEWLARSYVLTFGFVLYRIGCEVLNMWGHGTFVEQMSAASWFSWSMPLVITEAFLQGRKILIPLPKIRLPRRTPKPAWISIASHLEDLNSKANSPF